MRSPRLIAAAVVFAVAAWFGSPVFAVTVALSAALLLAAHDLHAVRPGVWFPVLATGLGVFVATRYDWRPPRVDRVFQDGGYFAYAPLESVVTIESVEMGRAFESALVLEFDAGWSGAGVVRLFVAAVVALGLCAWAWRARSPAVVVVALLYLTCAWYLMPEPARDGWSAVGFLVDDVGAPAHPELVLVAAAVVLFPHRKAPDWAPLLVVGPLGTLWAYGPLVGVGVLAVAALVLRSGRLAAATALVAVAALFGHQPFPAVVAVAAALVLAAHDLHARRPGTWFPLLVVGVGLYTAVLGAELLREDPFEDRTGGAVTAGGAVEWSMGWTDRAPAGPDLVDVVGYLLVALIVAALVVWAWRARSLVVLACAIGFLLACGAAFLSPSDPGVQFLSQDQYRLLLRPDPLFVPHPEAVFLAGAAVAFAAEGRRGVKG
ncbi:hypothetical protein [Saccharothrix australiensis]|uniref:hypothetical protein n=1 Tax=Saccharothrix australiensis TaxID=2072 RepID=UPI0011C43623|nr:hypothetical protein [Saccharothrix australiensis]